MSRRPFVIALLYGLSTGPAAAAELGDPTRPPGQGEVAIEALGSTGSPFQLTSILVSPNRQVAVVNGSSVEVGDEIGDATVVEILPHAVWLESGEEGIELRISGNPVKVAAKRDEEETE